MPIAIATPYLFTYICTRSGPSAPHFITPANHRQHMLHYPYDYTLYQPNMICRTCEFAKPARSKHCSLCRACIARSDHHCIWVNNCLGRGNYKYFLALLFSMTILLCYGAYLAQLVLMPQVRAHIRSYPTWHELEYQDSTDMTGRILAKGEKFLDIVATAFLVGGLSSGAVGLLAFLTAPLPAGLLGYHIYLVWAGMTTNESGKWSDWAEDMHDGLTFSAPIVNERVAKNANGWSNGDASNQNSPWPVRSKHFLVHTTDGLPPRNLQPAIVSVVGDVEWRRVWHLNEVENIYDLGFWDNLREVFLD
jgi:palmitoyltransferase ZDHHC4